MKIEPNKNLKSGEREIALEIYRQKNEIFRHFDNLRWHLPAIVLPASGAVLGLARNGKDWPHWWALLLVGLLSFLSGFAILRIRKGIKYNHKPLIAIAKQLGDKSIPERKKHLGASWWFMVFMWFFGAVSLVLGIWSLVKL